MNILLYFSEKKLKSRIKMNNFLQFVTELLSPFLMELDHFYPKLNVSHVLHWNYEITYTQAHTLILAYIVEP